MSDHIMDRTSAETDSGLSELDRSYGSCDSTNKSQATSNSNSKIDTDQVQAEWYDMASSDDEPDAHHPVMRDLHAIYHDAERELEAGFSECFDQLEHHGDGNDSDLVSDSEVSYDSDSDSVSDSEVSHNSDLDSETGMDVSAPIRRAAVFFLKELGASISTTSLRELRYAIEFQLGMPKDMLAARKAEIKAVVTEWNIRKMGSEREDRKVTSEYLPKATFSNIRSLPQCDDLSVDIPSSPKPYLERTREPSVSAPQCIDLSDDIPSHPKPYLERTREQYASMPQCDDLSVDIPSSPKPCLECTREQCMSTPCADLCDDIPSRPKPCLERTRDQRASMPSCADLSDDFPAYPKPCLERTREQYLSMPCADLRDDIPSLPKPCLACTREQQASMPHCADLSDDIISPPKPCLERTREQQASMPQCSEPDDDIPSLPTAICLVLPALANKSENKRLRRTLRGRRGSNFEYIQSQTDASISLEARGDQLVITIEGTESELQLAFEFLKDLIATCTDNDSDFIESICFESPDQVSMPQCGDLGDDIPSSPPKPCLECTRESNTSLPQCSVRDHDFPSSPPKPCLEFTRESNASLPQCSDLDYDIPSSHPKPRLEYTCESKATMSIGEDPCEDESMPQSSDLDFGFPSSPPKPCLECTSDSNATMSTRDYPCDDVSSAHKLDELWSQNDNIDIKRARGARGKRKGKRNV